MLFPTGRKSTKHSIHERRYVYFQGWSNCPPLISSLHTQGALTQHLTGAKLRWLNSVILRSSVTNNYGQTKNDR